MDRLCLTPIGCHSDLWVLLPSLLVISVIGLSSWWHRKVPGAKPLAIACLFGFAWLLGILGQVTADEIATKIAWYKFQTVWQVPGATATTWFSLEFAGYAHRLSRRHFALLAIPPFVALVMILTNDYHHLWWQGFTAGDIVRPRFGTGAGVLVGYGWALVFLNSVVLIQLFVRDQQLRWPVVLIIGGQVACRVLFVTYLVNLNLLVTPYILILAIMSPIAMYGIALFGFRIFDPLPRARRTAIEQMHEGMLVLDRDWRLLSVNPAAEKILGQSAAQLRGTTWQHLLSVATTDAGENGSFLTASGETKAMVPAEITLGRDADVRCYEVDLSPLRDRHASVAGWLLLLRDITARRHAQVRQVKEQQMLAVIRERERLARELHDSIGQVFAFINAQGQSARILLARGEIDAADNHVARLVEVACETDTDIRDSILGLRTRLSQQGFFPALTSYLTHYEQRHGICVSVRKSPAVDAGAMDPLAELQLMRIVQEALTNVRKHAHAASIHIDFAVVDDAVVTTVQDDGCGFDLREETRTGAGRFGLRVMQERAEEIGGSIHISSKPGKGTTVQVTVPLVPPAIDAVADPPATYHAHLVG